MLIERKKSAGVDFNRLTNDDINRQQSRPFERDRNAAQAQKDRKSDGKDQD